MKPTDTDQHLTTSTNIGRHRQTTTDIDQHQPTSTDSDLEKRKFPHFMKSTELVPGYLWVLTYFKKMTHPTLGTPADRFHGLSTLPPELTTR